MKTYKLFCVFFFCLALFSCSKKDEETPSATAENTAYYYLNGGLIVPKGYTAGVGFVKPITWRICSAPNAGLILFFNNKSETFQLFFNLGINNSGIYQLSAGGSDSACFYGVNFGYLSLSSTPGQEFVTSQNSGEVIITKISADKRKFSGTFGATLFDTNGQKVEITGGVFDINLDTL